MDELEQRIRAARPISGHRDLPLSDRAKRELADLMLADSAHHARQRPVLRRRRVLGVLSAAAAVAVVAVIVATSILAPQHAYAATPPLLQITTTGETAHELLTRLSQTVDAAAEASSSTIRAQTWTLSTADNGEAAPSVVLPEVHVVVRGADGSLTQVVTAGRAVDAAGNPVTGPDVPPEGQVIRTQNSPLVEMRPLGSPADVTTPVTFSMRALPDDPTAVGQFFTATTGTGMQPSAAAAIRTMNELLFAQVLSPSQQAALLVYFADLPDLTAAGTTVDRLGRDGAVFVAVDPLQPQYQQQLIISLQTGRVLGTEVIYVGTDRTDVPSPSVVHYAVWK